MLTSIILKWFSAVLPGSSAETTVAKRASSPTSSRNWVGKPCKSAEKLLAWLFYKIVNKLVAVDTGNLLRASTRNTKSNSVLSPAFINIQITKDCYKYFFFPRTIADWNQLSPRTRESTSVAHSKPSCACPQLIVLTSYQPTACSTVHVISLVELVCVNHQNQNQTVLFSISLFCGLPIISHVDFAAHFAKYPFAISWNTDIRILSRFRTSANYSCSIKSTCADRIAQKNPLWKSFINKSYKRYVPQTVSTNGST